MGCRQRKGTGRGDIEVFAYSLLDLIRYETNLGFILIIAQTYFIEGTRYR